MSRNENKCLVKGGVNENSKYFFMKNEGKLINEIKWLEELRLDQEQEMGKLKDSLKLKDEELIYLRSLKDENQKKIKQMQSDI